MANTKTPKNYHPEFKAKVALKAVPANLTVNQISKRFEVYPTQFAKLKKQLLENLPQIPDNAKNPQDEQDEKLINQLYSQIGQLKVELDWLTENYTIWKSKKRFLMN